MQRILDAARSAAFGVLLFALMADAVSARSPRGHADHEPMLDGNIPRTLPSLPRAVLPTDTRTRLDTFAWQNFIALMWPSLASGDGEPYEPDDPGVFARYDAQLAPAWMRWKTAFDLYPPIGSEPAAWDRPATQTVCRNVAARDRRPHLTMMADVVTLAGQISDAIAVPLPPPAGHYARIDVRINRAEYDYVRSNGYYDRSNWPARGEPPIHFPASTADRLGSIEVVAAWRNLATVPPELRARFFTADALAAEPGTCSADDAGRTSCDCGPMTAALVSFHIAHKIADFPQWTVSSFAQVDALGEQATVPPNMPASHQDTEPYDTQTNSRTEPPGQSSPDRKRPPYDHDSAPGSRAHLSAMPGTPADIATSEISVRYRQRLQGTIWEHYTLVGAHGSTAPAVPPAPLTDDAGFENGRSPERSEFAFPHCNFRDAGMQSDREYENCRHSHQATQRSGGDVGGSWCSEPGARASTGRSDPRTIRDRCRRRRLMQTRRAATRRSEGTLQDPHRPQNRLHMARSRQQ